MTPDEYARRRRAHADYLYRKRRKLAVARGIPTSLVNAEPAAEHITALAELGWSCTALADLIDNTITDVTLVNLLRGKYQRIERKTMRAVLTIPYTVNVPPAVDDSRTVPSLSATRRIRALQAIGWRHEDLAAHGIESTVLARAAYPSTNARKWRAVDAAYRELHMTPGPGRYTAQRAKVRGWAAPLDWDDIDDPTTTPTARSSTSSKTRSTKDVDPVVVERALSGRKTPATRAEKEEIVRRVLADPEKTLADLERTQGWNTHRIVNRLRWREKNAA